MEKEKEIMELIDLQFKLMKGFVNLVDPLVGDDEEKRAAIHKYVFAYMDLISAHVLENRLIVPKDILDEIGDWTGDYSDEELETMFVMYHEVFDQFIHPEKEEKEVSS